MDNAPQMTSERNAPPATLVITGASGDLTAQADHGGQAFTGTTWLPASLPWSVSRGRRW